MCATYYSVVLFLRKLLSTVKGIVFTAPVPGAQTELGRGAFMPSAPSLANSLEKDFQIERAELSVAPW